MELEFRYCSELLDLEGKPDRFLNLPQERLTYLEALQAQIKVGKCPEPKPSDSVSLSKWEIWSSLEGKERHEWMQSFNQEVISAVMASASSGLFQKELSNRENPGKQISLAQKIIRLQGGMEKEGFLTNSYLLPENNESEVFEKIAPGEKWSDDESGGSDNTYEHVEFSAKETPKPKEKPSIFADLKDSSFLESSPSPSPSQRSGHSLPTFLRSLDHEPSRETLFDPEGNSEDLSFKSPGTPRFRSLHFQIEELYRLSGHTLTRLESLERELALLQQHLERKERQNKLFFALLSFITIPCCLLSIWTLVKVRSR